MHVSTITYKICMAPVNMKVTKLFKPSVLAQAIKDILLCITIAIARSVWLTYHQQ